MFHPVGSQPPSVYWRRRLIVLASIVAILILLVLTIKVLFSGNSSPAAAGGSSSGAMSPSTTPGASSAAPNTQPGSSGPTTTSSHASTSQSSTSRGSSGSSSSSAPPPRCTAKMLSVTAASDKTVYPMNGQPQLSLLVTNTTKTPCVQDLSDKQVIMRVYNGESRVWGSHDCKIDPTPNERTLQPNAAVRLTIDWTGLSSSPGKCGPGQRQRVGAGTYTLYGSLSGKTATAAQFTIQP